MQTQDRPLRCHFIDCCEFSVRTPQNMNSTPVLRLVLLAIQSLNRVRIFATQWTLTHKAPLSFTICQSLSNSCPLMRWCCLSILSSVTPLLPSVFPSIRVFYNEWALPMRWSKYWSFSISLSNEYLALISFRIGWFGLLAVQGTLKSFLQHHSSKASVLRRSAFFVVQLTSVHDYRKNHYHFDNTDLCRKSDVCAF